MPVVLALEGNNRGRLGDFQNKLASKTGHIGGIQVWLRDFDSVSKVEKRLMTVPDSNLVSICMNIYKYMHPYIHEKDVYIHTCIPHMGKKIKQVYMQCLKGCTRIYCNW